MAKKEKLIKLDGYDELDGMLVPESWVPKLLLARLYLLIVFIQTRKFSILSSLII